MIADMINNETLNSIISTQLTLSSISSALLAQSINHTSAEENSELIVFIKECGEIF